jgi:murein DD-endopeptidase MepM/ murein hydrolase activator NlpD
LMTGPRFESYWNRSFLMPPGTIQTSYGDNLVYLYSGQEIGQARQTGSEFMLSNVYREVPAANDGIVAFSENLGLYGRCVGIDHGLGLVSVYGHLDQVLVPKGERVLRGQKIALAGNTGFSRNPNLFFEMRVQGVPVDPVEWWEDGWFYAHIVAKTNDIKKMLGLPVYTQLE